MTEEDARSIKRALYHIDTGRIGAGVILLRRLLERSGFTPHSPTLPPLDIEPANLPERSDH